MNKFLYIFILFFGFTFSSFAQDFFKSGDLSKINVDKMSSTEIANIQAQLQSSKTSIDMAEPMAKSKGMTASEFSKLRVRLQSLEVVSTVLKPEVVASNQVTETRKPTAINYQGGTNAIFGSEIFDNPSLTFEPNPKGATPANYILGPGDELQINVFGVQEFNATALVSTEGKINVQYVGQISVGGMTIEAAIQKIKSSFAKIYSTVASGQSKVGITLSKIRTIKVTIIGSKQSGNYSISSLSTVFNALYIAGGPSTNGTYRSIELIRNSKIIKIIDIYKFLIYGDSSDNLGLKDEDVIRIPVYNSRVTIEGQVKRPGIFELKKGENFLNLVEYASGFNDDAFTASINVTQKTNKEFKVLDVKENDFKNYEPQTGDNINVSKILNRFENKITIQGTVFRPNSYSFNEGMRVSDLIKKAEGLKEDAYKDRATIIRKKDDLTNELINVNINSAILGDIENNVLLKKDDVLSIYSLLDFKESYKVSISGEVKANGDFQYYENITLNDLLIQAGGLTGAASKKVEIARMIKSESFDDANPNRVESINLEITPENNEQVKNFILKPYDVIMVRRLPVFETPEFVNVAGSIVYPGKYPLINKTEKIYDVIMRAGGLVSYANPAGMRIRRPLKRSQISDIKNLNAELNENKDNKLIEKIVEEVKFANIPINWKEILKDKNSPENYRLFPGDEIQVPVFFEGVKVTGSVIITSEIPFDEGKNVNYYLDKVGGASFKSWKKKTYVIYPNGLAATTKSFLFFKSYPKITPGSQIVVPEKPLNENPTTTADILSYAGILASLAGVIIAILR